MKNIICGISGGVDSAVSAYLLKKYGFNVIGAFMTNWDPLDEGVECNIERDREDAQYVCHKLKIPFKDVDFVKNYWNDVFQRVLHQYERGLTPNPDILCNKFIKFKQFYNWAIHEQGAHAIATGHYAQTSIGYDLHTASENRVKLLRSKDNVKDQTFWLSQIDGECLKNTIFPVGDLLKPEVKRIAAEIGLNRTVEKKESMGICFIGKRKFHDFISSYVPPKNGFFKLLENGLAVGQHEGIHHFTIGQRAPIPVGKDGAVHYIAKMDYNTQDIFLVKGNSHPSLYMKSLVTSSPHWIHPDCNPFITSHTAVELEFQWQNKWRAIPCIVSPITTDSNKTSRSHIQKLNIELNEPMRCVSPGQFAVLYRDNECLGSAEIVTSTSLWEESVRTPVDWDYTHYATCYNSVM